MTLGGFILFTKNENNLLFRWRCQLIVFEQGTLIRERCWRHYEKYDSCLSGVPDIQRYTKQTFWKADKRFYYHLAYKRE